MIEKSDSEMSLQEQIEWAELPLEAKYKRAVPPLRMWCDNGQFKASRHKTVFDVREFDALDRPIDSFTVENLRQTRVENGKAVRFYEWYCTCGRVDCRHVAIAKRKYWAEFRKKKDAEAWLLKNDPGYVTAKMAAEGWVSQSAKLFAED